MLLNDKQFRFKQIIISIRPINKTVFFFEAFKYNFLVREIIQDWLGYFVQLAFIDSIKSYKQIYL